MSSEGGRIETKLDAMFGGKSDIKGYVATLQRAF